jgi:hypothetical protein
MYCRKYIEISRKIAEFSVIYDMNFHSGIQSIISDQLINQSSDFVKHKEQEISNDMSNRMYLFCLFLRDSTLQLTLQQKLY